MGGNRLHVADYVKQRGKTGSSVPNTGDETHHQLPVTSTSPDHGRVTFPRKFYQEGKPLLRQNPEGKFLGQSILDTQRGENHLAQADMSLRGRVLAEKSHGNVTDQFSGHCRRDNNQYTTFDNTDTENLDDNSTLSHDIQIEDSQAKMQRLNGPYREPAAVPNIDTASGKYIQANSGVADGDEYEGQELLVDEDDEACGEQIDNNIRVGNDSTVENLVRAGWIPPDEQGGFATFISGVNYDEFSATFNIPRNSKALSSKIDLITGPQALLPSKQDSERFGIMPLHGRISPLRQETSRVQSNVKFQPVRRTSSTDSSALHDNSKHDQIIGYPQEQYAMKLHSDDELSQSSEARLRDMASEDLLNEIELQGSRQPEHKRSVELDYNKSQLLDMNYDQLQSESFDYNPRAPAAVPPDDLQSRSMSEQLHQINNISSQSEGDRNEQQMAYFSSLSIDQYDECGDLIVDQFASILNKFKQARQEKRKIAQDFEREVAERERNIRGRAGLIDKDLTRLRRAGEDVINGRGV